MPNYTEEDIRLALEKVRQNWSIRSAAKHHHIPRTTLQDRFNGSQSRSEAHEQDQRVGRVAEAKLAEWVLLQASLGLPPTYDELRYYAQAILEAGGDTTPLGKRWVNRFLARYPCLGPRQSRRMENARVEGATTEVITAWWPRLRHPLVADIPPERRWNMDEGGLMEGLGTNGLVLGAAGTRPLQRKGPGSRSWTSVIECVSAAGDCTPPLIIFKGASVQKQWFPADLDVFGPWRFTATENGWTDNETAVHWLREVFLPATQPPTPSTRLLIMDGHRSHITKEFMLLCLQHDVQPIYLPPHTSHVLQPLDLSVFSPLKSAYRRQINKEAQFCCSTTIGKRLFLEYYYRARVQTFTSVVLKAGWRATGLWPLNIAKPLMSRLLLKNSNAHALPATTTASGRKRRSRPIIKTNKRRAPAPPTTPQKGRNVTDQIATYTATIPATSNTRLLFRKIRKGYDAKDVQLATSTLKIKELEARLEAALPRKRKRVAPDPNEALVNCRAILAAEKAGRAPIHISSDSPEDGDSSEAGSVIVVA